MSLDIYNIRNKEDPTKKFDKGEHIFNKYGNDSGYRDLDRNEQTEVDDYSFKSILDSGTDKIKESSGLFSRNTIDNNRFTKFARVPILDPYNTSLASREFLFFTKPDLHIYDNNSYTTSNGLYEPLKNSDFFLEAISKNTKSILSLQQTLTKSDNLYYNQIIDNQFNILLSNMVSSQLEFPDIVVSETQNNTNLYNITTTYRDGSEVSDNNYDFSLEFKDTKNLDVYMWFKAYDEYCREEYKRNIIPAKVSYIDNMINYKEFSIFKIIVDDMFNIIYYGKATGVYPLNVPRSSLLTNDQDIRFSVNFKAQFVQDMRPYILDELNYLTAKSCKKPYSLISKAMNNNPGDYCIPMYDSTNNVSNTDWAMYPFINKNKDSNSYRLDWLSDNITKLTR